MRLVIEKKHKMKKEIFFALCGILLLAALFIFYPEEMYRSSPLALFLIVLVGFLLAFNFKLTGGVSLFFGGFALALYPLLFSSSYLLLPGGIVTALSGSLIILKWWKQEEQ